jgi:hypothetical protein
MVGVVTSQWADSSYVWFAILKYFSEELGSHKAFIENSKCLEECRLIATNFCGELDLTLTEIISEAKVAFVTNDTLIPENFDCYVVLLLGDSPTYKDHIFDDSFVINKGSHGYVDTASYVYFMNRYSFFFTNLIYFGMPHPSPDLENSLKEMRQLSSLVPIKDFLEIKPEKKSFDLIVLDIFILYVKKLPYPIQLRLKTSFRFLLTHYRNRLRRI